MNHSAIWQQKEKCALEKSFVSEESQQWPEKIAHLLNVHTYDSPKKQSSCLANTDNIDWRMEFLSWWRHHCKRRAIVLVTAAVQAESCCNAIASNTSLRQTTSCIVVWTLLLLDSHSLTEKATFAITWPLSFTQSPQQPLPLFIFLCRWVSCHTVFLRILVFVAVICSDFRKLLTG